MNKLSKKKWTDTPLAGTVICFICIIIIFNIGFHALERSSFAHRRDHLELAVNRNIVRYYATYGYYPEDISRLTADYGLIYDEREFYIDYRMLGDNIYPDVTIIMKEQ